MHNELLKIGPFTMYGYGTMIGIGILCAYVMAEVRARKNQYAFEHVFYLFLWCVAGGFLGAKLLFFLTEWKAILQDPTEFFYMLADGFVVYGGILGGIAAGFFYCKTHSLSFFGSFDLLAPSLSLAQGIGRIGCFLAGCCYGKETTSPVSVIFHTSDYAPNQIPLIPVQLYASALDFLLMGILLWTDRHKKQEGTTAARYLIFYSAGRFLLEFFRGDVERGMAGGLSTSQYISFFTGITGLLLLGYLRGSFAKKNLHNMEKRRIS